jgi:sugar O-acyltransferase (sialic acid O-acetyltransferase NeuD family)
MADNIIIIGAGGGSGELVSLIRHAQAQGAMQCHLLGILDDEDRLQGKSAYELPVLGALEDWTRFQDARFISGIANSRVPRVRLKIVERLGIPDSRWATFVSPLAFVAETGHVGVGSILYPGAVVSTEARVGKHCVVYYHSVVHHHSSVGDGCCVAASVAIAGETRIGAGCYVGLGANIKDHVEIGDGALIGMGSVVIDDVSADTRVAGVPARVLRRG